MLLPGTAYWTREGFRAVREKHSPQLARFSWVCGLGVVGCVGVRAVDRLPEGDGEAKCCPYESLREETIICCADRPCQQQAVLNMRIVSYSGKATPEYGPHL